MDQLDFRAIRNGVIASLLLVLGIYFGSGQMRHFDPALITYTSAVVFATFGITYRYSIWLQKPPTQLYWRRGWQLFLRPSRLPANLLHLGVLFVKNFILQTFIGFSQPFGESEQIASFLAILCGVANINKRH